MIDIGRGATTIRKARADELPRISAILADAFYDDPAMRWAIDDDRRRRDLLERAFGLFLRTLWFKQDECYTTAGTAGAIVWELPGQWKTGLVDQLRLFGPMARIYGRRLPRILRALAALESNHPVEPHFYLPLVGVQPGWQGRGLGTALLRPILDRCDDENVPAYLEASSPRNRDLYERHGFRVTEEFLLGPGSPPLWRMWRTPNHRGSREAAARLAGWRDPLDVSPAQGDNARRR
jgi:GNAT superfamily N-acetyltransferase